MDKKELQKRRMMSYFIEATNKIIEEEGLEAVTVRKVADIAGYNSATLYNYFTDLEHLTFYASIKYLKDYVLDVPNFIKSAPSALEKYLGIWKCFCFHSFSNPRIYYTIFFNKHTESLSDALQEYYEIFPEELGDQTHDILPMFLKRNIYERNITALQSLVHEGILDKADLEEINEMTLLIYQGMFIRLFNLEIDYSTEVAMEKTLKYIKRTLMVYCIDSTLNRPS
ncbi:TetR/AcrR family transcriptional regulator [Alkaliphilus transvaalensis]|uniref:TetR/AcrR family transcriptional regulator n=1 Tax=Alkaliphilus transvaalensis TaxID=114628 RepID=UPI000478F1D9|nr:TetR/AcrR family transcriptional regulator [Alkaliphilus transvaalensis]